MPIPATFTRPSSPRPDNRDSISAAAAAMEVSFSTSSNTGKTLPAKSARSRVQSDSLRTVANTCHPARLIRLTEDHPIPLEAPLITTAFVDTLIHPERSELQGRDEIKGGEVAELARTKKSRNPIWSRLSVGWLPG